MSEKPQAPAKAPAAAPVPAPAPKAPAGLSFGAYYRNHYRPNNSNIHNQRIQAVGAGVGLLRGLYSTYKFRPIKLLTSVLIMEACVFAGRGIFEKGPLISAIDQENIQYFAMAPFWLLKEAATGEIKLA